MASDPPLWLSADGSGEKRRNNWAVKSFHQQKLHAGPLIDFPKNMLKGFSAGRHFVLLRPSQVGCKVGCQFLFNCKRWVVNLTVGEYIAKLFI